MSYYRRNIIVLSFTIFLAATSWNQVFPFLPLFMGEMGLHDKADLLRWVGYVTAVQSVASIVSMPLWGKLGDSHGRKPMVIRAGLFLSAIYFGTSLCRTPLQLAVLRFLNGALTGFIPGSMALIATNTPQKQATRAVATAQAFSALGMIVGPGIGQALASAVGYRGSMRVSGAAVLISTLLVIWLVQEPNKPKPSEKTSLIQDFVLSLKSPVLRSMMFTVMVQAVFGAAISPYLALHIGGMDKRMIGAVFCLPAVAFVLSARAWTHLGERWGFHTAILIGLAGTSAASALLFLTHNVWLFSVLYFVAGLFLAAISPGAAAIICTRVDEGFRGRAYGMQTAAGTVGACLAPLAASRIAIGFGIPSIFVFVGAVFLLSSFLYHGQTKDWSRAAQKS